MAGRLYRMAKVVSANPASWGIVDANQISGFRTVAKLTDLYSIAACILSSSYGDGTTTGADAVGQIWHVQENGGADYRLTSWVNRGTSAGWTKVLYADSVYSKSEIDGKISVINNNISAANSAALAAQATANANSTAINKKANKDTVDTLGLTVAGHTTSIGVINNTLKNKADSSTVTNLTTTVDNIATDLTNFKALKGAKNGLATLDANKRIPLEQLGNLDMTVFTVVSVLPTSNIENKVYLLSNGTSGDNKYEEYIYTGDRSGTYDATKWERLGSIKASVDMTNYYTKTETTEQIKLWRVSLVYIGKENDHSTNLQFYVFDKQGHGVGKIIPVVTSELNGLMSPTMLTKLNGIAEGANKYAHPARKSTASDKDGLYKITVDELGHVSKTTAVGKSDIASLAPDLTMTPKYSNINVSVVANYNGNDKTATIAEASNDNAGVMSTSMYAKLHAIADGATRNVIDQTLTATGTNAVQGKAVYDAINTHKLTDSNLSSTAVGNTYNILGECDSETNEIGALTDSLMYQYSADHSTLSIDGAAVWDEYTLKAITNDELTKILV